MSNIKNIFISYSWDDENHRLWVKKVADDLEVIPGFHVKWDGYDLDSLIDKNKYMEDGVFKTDYVIVIATNKYKEKADDRNGGVGIETFMTTAMHWKQLQESGKTKIITVIREKDSTPNYLLGNFYIDFTSDDQYQSSLQTLIGQLKEKSLYKRPEKNLAPRNTVFEFTKIDELLKINYVKRKALISGKDSTDFSDKNRIKYEVWETLSPLPNYFLVLADNINISQTITHVANKIKDLSLQKITFITILRPKSGDDALIESVLKLNNLSINIKTYTYKEYIWQFCIDDGFKNNLKIEEIANYTDQTILFFDEGHAEHKKNSGAEFLAKKIRTQPSRSTAHLVVAQGGMGKSSLCLSIASKLQKATDFQSSVILIQAESVQRYVSESGGYGVKIESIYQLYELYARSNNFSDLFDKNTFDIAFLSGNLIVIIDGLDEFSSIFPDGFNLENFMHSLYNFHKELGSSAVLLTTRNSQFISDDLLHSLSIEKYELLGFDKGTCKSYLNRRFKKYPDNQKTIEDVLNHIESIDFHDSEERIVPFFIDITATVVEDGIKKGKKEELIILEDATPYPSNNDFTDHIIHSVLKREQTRQNLDISVKEIIEFIAELVAAYNKRWPKLEMKTRLELLYDERGLSLSEKFSSNPLFVVAGDQIELRYGFLSSYFNVLYIINSLQNASIEEVFLRSISKLNSGSNEYREILRFYGKDKQTLKKHSRELISKIIKDKSRLKNKKPDVFKKSISGITAICFDSLIPTSLESRAELLCEIYPSYDESLKSISDIHIRGEIPAIDLSRFLQISDSTFTDYKNFLKCKFGNSKFIYCKFDVCNDQGIKSADLKPENLDHTCEVGDLRGFFNFIKFKGKEDESYIEDNIKKFLHCFVRNQVFIDVKEDHIKFSNCCPGLERKNFNRLIAGNYVIVKSEKVVATFYKIAPDFRESVQKYLTNNYKNAMMRDFIAFVKEKT